jgi:tetratricopeptide (TPR) repeat protein
VPTFTERPHLSREVNEKICTAHGTGLAHAIAVTGIGGTGKTQLVLRYIEGHEEEYDTVLWIDARSEETARASYERCCRTLGLLFEAPIGDGPLQDVPSVQAVLLWLRCRAEDKRWLVVVDNADDLSWDVSSIVPKGKAGTVIVTSQDAQSSRLLGGRTPTVSVDAMEPEEAVRLVSNYFDEPVSRGDDCWALVEEITESLDRLALAIDLAGARVHVDLENGDGLASVLRQYLADYRRSRERLLRDEEFAYTSTYKKTVWTAWETSLASLRKVEDSRTDAYPVRLLSFLTFFDRTSVQDELFRLAGLGWKATCKQLGVSAPTWLQCLLATSTNGQWEASHYRAGVRTLLRYGLIRSTKGSWSGLTMHSLVQWRVQQLKDIENLWPWFVIFISSASFQHLTDANTIIFRKYMVVHFPHAEILVNQSSRIVDAGKQAWIWLQLGQVWEAEGRWTESEEVFTAVVYILSEALGQGHAETLCAMAHLASTFRKQGLWRKAGSLEMEVLNARLQRLGIEHPDTLRAMAQAANALYDQGRYQEVIELEAKVCEARSILLGEEHPDTISAMANLAATYWNQERLKEAEELEVKVVEARRRVLGEEHPDTITAIANLAATYWNQGRLKETEELFVKVLEASRRVLGEEHPDTITAMANLSHTKRALGQNDVAVD